MNALTVITAPLSTLSHVASSVFRRRVLMAGRG